jgi:hypothetical protein
MSTHTGDAHPGYGEDVRVSAPAPFPCPHCDSLVIPRSPACPSCGLRLVGPQAARLWQVNQQIGSLRAEADRLVAELLRPVPAGAPSPVPGAQSPYPAFPGDGPAFQGNGPVPYPASQTHRGGSGGQVGGQQILLGLGALLLLSGVSFFLLVVWLVVGVAGQATIMVALTGAAAAGAAVATRRRLTSTARAAAGIATGLLVIDLWAAHHLGLAGLEDFPADGYWSVAALVGVAVLLGFDRLVPRSVDGAPAPAVLVYRPAAATLLAAAGWCAVSAAEPGLVVLCGLALGLGLLNLTVAAAAYRFDRWAAVPLLISAVAAGVLHLLSGVYVGYDPASSASERYAVVALLLVLPLLALTASRREFPGSGWVAVVGVWALVPALGIPVVDAPRAAVVVLAVLIAAVLAGLSLAGRPVTRLRLAGLVDRKSAPPSWVDAAILLGWVALPVLFQLVLVTVDEGYESGLELFAGFPRLAPDSWWLPVVPALAAAAAALVAAVKERSVPWAVLAQVAVAVTAFTAVRHEDQVLAVVMGLVGCAVSFALAGYARSLGESVGARVLDLSAVAFALFYGGTGIFAAFDEDPMLEVAAWLGVGVLTLVYAGAPRRLPFAYLGSLLVTAGTGRLLDDRGVGVIEAYTASLVLLLAVIGAVQASRDRQAPTMLTMGPALSVALLPSLAATLEGGSALRLAGVTVVAILALGIGLLRGWRAPVTVGALVLVVVAINQGGPYMAYVPGWVILVGGGAVLLTAGVLWERALLAGRRTQAWYAALR